MAKINPKTLIAPANINIMSVNDVVFLIL